MLADSIIKFSTPMQVYYVETEEVQNGIINRTYNTMQIYGSFQPLGQFDKMGKMYNEVDGKWRLFTLRKYRLFRNYFVEFDGEYYKVVEVKDWAHFGASRGYYEYRLELATIKEIEAITGFWEKTVKDEVC